MKIDDSDKKIAIIGGCGHVGLPLGLALASNGFQVDLIDSSTEKVALVNSGTMPFLEDGADDLLLRVLAEKTLNATTDESLVVKAHVVIIVVGTPVDEHFNPDPAQLRRELNRYLKFLNSDQLLILRSTVFPGVTRNTEQILKEVGLQTQIAFCPERIVEGQALKEIASLPQIIGAYDSETHERAKRLFETLGVKCVPLTPEEAELAKLFTNYWRYVKFAAANQLWSISQELDLDYSKIRNALSLDYPRAKDLPMSGFTAGPCLLKDSAQLVAFSGLGAPLISSSIEINENLPKFMVQAVEKKFQLDSYVVGILGMAFKGESDDIRGSLAFKLRKLLLFRSKQVLCSDPFVVDERLVSQEEVLSQCDLIFIGAPHKQYLNVDFKVPVIDIWDLLGQGVKI